MTTAQRKQILLVDDDSAGAELTVAALTMLDPEVEVEVAADGEEALDFMFQRGPFQHREAGLPAVVLLDLKMPKVDGHEVLRQIRSDAKLRTAKVVVLTSSDQQIDRIRSRELGCDGYLVKPASITGLLELLRSCPDVLPPSDSTSS